MTRPERYCCDGQCNDDQGHGTCPALDAVAVGQTEALPTPLFVALCFLTGGVLFILLVLGVVVSVVGLASWMASWAFGAP